MTPTTGTTTATESLHRPGAWLDASATRSLPTSGTRKPVTPHHLRRSP